jgi:hypothetical protein
MCRVSYFAPMKSTAIHKLLGAFAIIAPLCGLSQGCPNGQSPFEMRVHTDAWGYELYWELGPEGALCGDSILYWGGNAVDVGCDGDGIPGAPVGNYASNSTFILDTLCGTPGELLTLHYVDSYGDGGTFFEVFAGDVLNHSFAGTGNGNVWSFDPFSMTGPAYDSPCGAEPIAVDGPVVVLSNDSCTAGFGEPGAPNFEGIYSCQINGGWCEAAVTGSVWLSFEATSGNCRISACNDTTDFDTQLALWRAEDCGDFDTYTLVSANDDMQGGCGSGNGYASTMATGCLDSGATYLIQVDGWLDDRGTVGITIETDNQVEDITSSSAGLSCPLGKEELPNGTVILNPLGMGADFTAAWIGPNGYSGEGQQISGLAAGTYSAVIVSSCGTALTHSVTLTQPDPISIDLDVVQPDCPELSNGSANIAVEGGTAPYSITWFGELGELGSGESIAELAEGAYQVNMEDDNGCTQELNFVLEAPDDALTFSLGPDTTICDDEQLVLSAPPGLEYLWSNGSSDQFVIVNGADLGPGTYPFTVQASNAFGCGHADAIFITVFECTSSVGEVESASSDLRVFPNPLSGGASWTIAWDTPEKAWKGAWELRDAAGRKVKSGLEPAGAATVKVMVPSAGLPAGQYLWHASGTEVSVRLQLH